MAKFRDIINSKISRRNFVLSSAALIASLNSTSLIGNAFAENNDIIKSDYFTFNPIKADYTDKLTISEDFDYSVLIGWGDELFDITEEDKKSLSKIQEKSFGYNNDFIAVFPIKRDSALLCVNHEYPIPELMYNDGQRNTDSVEYEMAAIGASIVEIKRENNKWGFVKNSSNNRRISTLSTEFEITGPAAANARLKTSSDRTGKKVIGTLANCGGGKTPWNTFLSCEENIDDYFGANETILEEYANHQSMGIARRSKYGWEDFIDRFNATKEPNEPNRFGWVVEINPFDKDSKPKKLTALGRFKHESAACVLNKDNKVVVYMGDDEVFEHIYKFVSKKTYNPKDLENDILDSGTLYVAQFNDDKTLNWLPLEYGNDIFNEKNGFFSQADVLIETRRSAKLLDATEMDRPEDIKVNSFTNKVYISLTSNIERLIPNDPNPKIANIYGHIIELTPVVEDHAATKAYWKIFSFGGEDGSFSNPDNLAISAKRNLWVATDGMPKSKSVADGIFMFDDDGKALRLLNAPMGAEVTGPEFTEDGKTLFLSVQHPGEGSDYTQPSTRWPDFKDENPPRPAIIAIARKNGEVI